MLRVITKPDWKLGDLGSGPALWDWAGTVPLYTSVSPSDNKGPRIRHRGPFYLRLLHGFKTGHQTQGSPGGLQARIFLTGT